MIVRDVIEALSEYHQLGVVYNHSLLEAILIPTDILLSKAQSNGESVFASDPELFLFDHSFTINEVNQCSYAQLKNSRYYKPPHPPPEEVDSSLKSPDPRLMDSWYVDCYY